MRYDAFISYRHADLDLYIAKKIHKGLETLKVPRAVAKKTGKKKIKRVFRDQEELPIGSDLGDNIESALKESEYLLVICSPRTPESYWVQKEISTFIEMHGREHILAVLIEGEPDQSFPKQLLKDDEGNPVEPLAADLRGRSRYEISRKLKTEILRLAAPLLHCTYDDLRQRHRERKMKRLAVSMGIAALLGLLFGAYSTYSAALIQQNYEGKQRNQSKYLADTSFSLLEEGDRRAAVLVAMEALPSKENDRPYVAEAQYALSQALYCYDTGNQLKMDRILQHELPVSDFYLNQTGTRVVSIDQGDTIYIWDIENGEKLAQISPQLDENGYLIRVLSVSLWEEHVIVCERDSLRSFDFNGQEEWAVEFPTGMIDCEMDETAHMAACISSDEVLFYDTVSGEQIGSMPNRQKTFFSSQMTYNQDKTLAAVTHVREEAEASFVSVYDFKTKKVTELELMNAYITDLAFTREDDLIVTLAKEEDLSNYEQIMGTGYIQKFDWKNQQLLWENTYEYQLVGYSAVSSRVKCRSYQDQITGEVHDEVVMTVDNVAYTWDGSTGEKITELSVESGIINFMMAVDNSYAFLGQNDGTIDFVDMTNGIRYSDSAVETGKEMRGFSIRNGVVVLRAYASPDLTVMKYPDGADVTELETYEKGVLDIVCSKEETCYAVSIYDSDVTSRIYFYRTEDNQFVNEWVEKGGSSVIISGFVDEQVYMLGCMDGTLLFYDVETGKKETLSAGRGFTISEYCVNKDNSLAFIYSYYKYGLIDLKQRKVLAVGELEDSIGGAAISEDGKQVYLNTSTNGVCILDMETGKLIPVELAGYEVLNSGENEKAFSVSSNGKLLAVNCRDGKVRVLDVEKMETAAEFPFRGINRIFMEFGNEDTRILLQGDDYYFRVYDLKEKEFSYISTSQYYEIRRVIVDEQSGTISLVTIADINILNLEDYEQTARIEGGKIYLPKKGCILSSDYQTIYQFPYMTLEMLQKEAEEQFKGEKLTEMEKIRFHVE